MKQSRQAPSPAEQILFSRYRLLLRYIFGPKRTNEDHIKGLLSDLNEPQLHVVCTESPKWMKELAKDARFPLTESDRSYTESPIRKAWINGDETAIRCMVECGLNPNREVDAKKQTLLHWAAEAGKQNFCNFLLLKGADNFLPDIEGKIPAVLALDNHKHDTLDELILGCPQEERSKLFKNLSECKEFENSSNTVLRKFFENGMSLKKKDRKRILEVFMKLNSRDVSTKAIKFLQEKGMKPPSGKYKDFIRKHQPKVACPKASKLDLFCKFTKSFGRGVKKITEQMSSIGKHADKRRKHVASLISKNLGNDWKEFFRVLCFDMVQGEQETLIQEIEESHRLTERAFQVMLKYYNTKGDDVDFAEIKNALCEIGRKDIADKISC